MAGRAAKHPTELELEILKVLWNGGPMPVRRVRDGLAAFRPLAYTSVMTVMNIMVDKGYLARRKADGGFVYRARVRQGATVRRMLRDLVDRAFDGSPAAVMTNLIEADELDARQIRRLRSLIDRKLGEQGQ